MAMSVWPVGLFKAPVRSAAVVEDAAAARPQAQWLRTHCEAAAVAKLLRLAFQAQSRSVLRFDRRFGSYLWPEGAFFTAPRPADFSIMAWNRLCCELAQCGNASKFLRTKRPWLR